MTNKIFRSVLVSTLTVLVIAIGLFCIAANNYAISLEYTQLERLATLAEAGIETGNTDYLETLQDEDFRITWISEDGTVLYDNEANASTMENHLQRSEVQQALISGEGKSTRNSKTIGAATMYYAKRLADGTVLRTAVDRMTIGMMILSMLTPILWILIAAIALSLLAAKSVSKLIVKPLNQLNLDEPMSNKTYQEIYPLLTRIDYQNKQIDAQMRELREKKHEFETITSSISEGLILLNTDYVIVSMNPAAATILHLDDPQNGTDIRTLKVDPKVLQMMDEAKNGISNVSLIEIDDRMIQFDVSPIESEQRIHGISILSIDITEQYEAERQRREFTANVSHELKTPLQSIMGSAELMENKLVKPEDTDQFLHRIRTESARLLQLIDDIIQLSQLDDTTNVSTEKLNLSDIAQEAIVALQDSAKKNEVMLDVHLNDAVIEANSRLVYEICYNLIDNAIRYNKAGGHVVVETLCENNTRKLIVSDNGIGIPESSINRIFERFYRVDKSHSRATGGTGLGLSIVKHAVQVCKGTIKVQSKVGQGTKFTVSFKTK